MSITPALPAFPLTTLTEFQSGEAELSVGMDLVLMSRIQASVERFGTRFLTRVFTPEEQAYAQSSIPLMFERLAARFAAKEAALKALGLAGQGVAWVDMAVVRQADGSVALQLSGQARVLAERMGVLQTALSISHDGAYAAAIVVAIVRK